MDDIDDLNIINEEQEVHKETDNMPDEDVLLPQSLRDNISMIGRVYGKMVSSETLSQIQLTANIFKNATNRIEKICVGLDTISEKANKRFQIPEIPQPALQFADALSNLSQTYTPAINEELLQNIQRLCVSDSVVDAIEKLQNTYTSMWRAFDSPVVLWFQSFNWSHIYNRLSDLTDKRIDFGKIKRIFLQEMYDAHWYPDALMKADLSLAREILTIIRHTRHSKSRTQKIDKAIFAYYTDNRIEEIKKSWRKLGLPEYLMRLLHQSVQAYHRKEYGMTVIVMTTQWEGIICNKVHAQSGWRTQNKSTGYFHDLTDGNNYPKIFQSFYDDFIVYPCHSPQDNIVDVPGRNSAAHSFYDKYPTRKAALNAILFTDFLLNIQPLQEEGEDVITA